MTFLHSWCQIGPVSNWCRCQIDPFTLLVSNWYRCQIDSFTLLVSNCPPHTLGVKLTPVSNWCRCQIVLQPFSSPCMRKRKRNKAIWKYVTYHMSLSRIFKGEHKHIGWYQKKRVTGLILFCSPLWGWIVLLILISRLRRPEVVFSPSGTLPKKNQHQRWISINNMKQKLAPVQLGPPKIRRKKKSTKL